MNHLKEIIDYGVIGLLIVMSFISVWLTIERWLFFRSVKLEEYRTKEELEVDLTNNISVVATIASSAPYIGLLGTVFGIMLTFYSMGQQGMVDTKTIMIGLALALKATAMGLLVAIPATWFYNYLVRKVEVTIALWEAKYAS